MGAEDELYDPDDFDLDDTGDDRAYLVGQHTEAESRYYRDEMRRRQAHCEALGVGREFRELMDAQRKALPEPARKALPAPIPETRRLPAPKEDESNVSGPDEEEGT